MSKLRIGTWNVEYARTGETNARRVAAMAAVPADVWVLTETHDDLSPSGNYQAVHSAQRPAADRRVVDKSRWVSIWSKFPIERIVVDDSDEERTVAAKIKANGVEVIVYGTVMPWRGDTGCVPIEAMRRQAADWSLLAERYPGVPLFVAGDFNDDMLPVPKIYHSAPVLGALRDGLRSNGLECATNNAAIVPPHLIDHIAIPSLLAQGARVAAFWKEFVGNPRLADHYGIVVEVDMKLLPESKRPLHILVAGPYRSGTGDDPAKIQANVDAMTETSLRLFRAGHLPVMGEWYALPLIEHAGAKLGDPVFDEIFHPISRLLVAKCDACLRIGGQSAGADEMVALAREAGAAVYFDINDVPPAR